ncbi:RNA recognition motif domain [Dillenia turbinata]|uniref:RNA recognition motif domain n=1 Tax=Dillenia turbinata TaxID=194707 RepID=A0AAN8ZSR2_9MAGN
MAASSISIAVHHTVCNKIPALSIDHPAPISTPIYTPFISLKSKLKHSPLTTTHNPISPPPFLHHLCRASSAFETASEEEDPEIVSEEEEEEGTDEKYSQSLSSEARRLYVGNLPYWMTSSQLSEVFSEAGRVGYAEIVYDRVTDRSRGFGFVTMGSHEEAQEAIRKFDGSQVGGRTVKVNFPEVPQGGEREVMGPNLKSIYKPFVDSPHKIYAGNLGWGLTSQGLRDAFADQPGFLSAKVIYDRASGRSRGFGFITFESAEEMESARNAMDGVEVEGRPLRLSVAFERPAAASRVAEENTNPQSSDMLSSVGV